MKSGKKYDVVSEQRLNLILFELFLLRCNDKLWRDSALLPTSHNTVPAAGVAFSFLFNELTLLELWRLVLADLKMVMGEYIESIVHLFI